MNAPEKLPTPIRAPAWTGEISFTVKGFAVDATASVQFADFVAARRGSDDRPAWELMGLRLTDVSISYLLSDGSKGLHVELRSIVEGEDNESTDLFELGYLEGYVSSRMPLDVFWTKFFDEAMDAVKNAMGTPHCTEA